MGLYKITAVLGYSILFAAVIGLVLYEEIRTEYRPFLYIVWLGFVNHNLSLIMVYYFKSNAINGNIFVLVESLLYLRLFGNLGIFNKRKDVFSALVLFIISTWIMDNIVFHNLQTANAGFRIINSFVMIFLAIEQLNVLIVTVRKNLLRNSIFTICCGVLIYFTYKTFIEVFFLVEMSSSIKLITNIYSILVYINCFVNLLFAWAVLWIPRKKQSLFLH